MLKESEIYNPNVAVHYYSFGLFIEWFSRYDDGRRTRNTHTQETLGL